MEVEEVLKTKIVKDLETAPDAIAKYPLDSHNLHNLSLTNPKEFSFLAKTLCQWPIITSADVSAIMQYLLTGRALSIVDPTLGIFNELITQFKQVLGLERAFGITFNSGTNALNAAYRACGLERGDFVAGAGYTYHATVTPVLELGGNLILMDASPDDGNLTLQIVKETVETTPQIKIVAVNHNWGAPIREIAEIKSFLAQRKIRLIEDCSHAHGSSIGGRSVGNFGDISVFSLQANKTVTGGEGGLCFGDEDSIKTRLLLVGHEDTKEATYTTEINPSVRQTGIHGLQFRMHPLAAVLAISQLNLLPQFLNNRRENYEYLRGRLQSVPFINFPEESEQVRTNHYKIRLSYNPHSNHEVEIHHFQSYLKKLGIPIAVDNSGPLARKAIFQQYWPEYGSQALPERRFYTPSQFPGISKYCENRLVFPVLSRSHTLVKGLLDVIADHIASFKR